MAVVARTVGRARPQLSFTDAEAIDGVARLLLVAVALDLIVTRFVVRLAIFVPKGEPFASASAVLGRIGAATDAFVPIVGILLLAALLVRAGRVGDRLDRAMLVAVAVIAVAGIGLVAYPPTPIVAVVLDLLLVAVAVAAALQVCRAVQTPRFARLGILSLAAAIALAALGRMADLGAIDSVPPGIAIGALGQVAFVAGTALVGLAGVVDLVPPRAPRRGLVALGFVMALLVLTFGLRAPATWGALAVWSVGLTGLVPVSATALAIGLAAAGLPALHRRAPASAIGASIVVLAGYGLAASGLALAGLLGLLVVRGDQAIHGELVSRARMAASA